MSFLAGGHSAKTGENLAGWQTSVRKGVLSIAIGMGQICLEFPYPLSGQGFDAWVGMFTLFERPCKVLCGRRTTALWGVWRSRAAPVRMAIAAKNASQTDCFCRKITPPSEGHDSGREALDFSGSGKPSHAGRRMGSVAAFQRPWNVSYCRRPWSRSTGALALSGRGHAIAGGSLGFLKAAGGYFKPSPLRRVVITTGRRRTPTVGILFRNLILTRWYKGRRFL
jgi:hypothetical protein